MTKRITLFCKEKINKDVVEVEHGIYNGFGKMVALPSTYEIQSKLNNFDPNELGDLFIEVGQRLKMETLNITNITINYSFVGNPTDMGKQFMVMLSYDTVED